MLQQLLLWTVVAFSATTATPYGYKPNTKLIVESHINPGPSFDVVSSLIIGSEAAVIIDLPLAIPQARDLAYWVRNTTEKPLVAAFSTHFHPDHYLSGAAFLEQFPGTPYYANAKTIEHMETGLPFTVEIWSGVNGRENIVQDPTLPEPYNYSIFTLPGDEASPIHLISPMTGDTVDETLFWIPSVSTLIAGDAIYGNSIHIWLADLLTPALTAAWLSTIEFIENLAPRMIVPGHAINTEGFGSTRDLEYSKKYLQLFQSKIEAKGLDFYTPEEITNVFDHAFPGLLESDMSTSSTILNLTAQEFGRGGSRFPQYVDLKSYTNISVLEGWELG